MGLLRIKCPVTPNLYTTYKFCSHAEMNQFFDSVLSKLQFGVSKGCIGQCLLAMILTLYAETSLMKICLHGSLDIFDTFDTLGNDFYKTPA